MRTIKSILLVSAVVLAALTARAQLPTPVTFAGDPTATQCYTLRNGLKVYLSVNKQSPRISALIAVRTGSRNDPPETTGLAHYLEHLMFKGTKQFGTSNPVAEAPLLDTIQARYEQYRQITDPARRRQLYHEIDSISQIAAQYNIPNEYDKLMSGIGAVGTNAYTSNDVTCYTEDIPANEVDRWARIQADRFRNMVIRGFHTELEAVYEEKNMSMAKDDWKAYEALYAKAFPTHPYGTQTTIGTQDHLKNPSIVNIKNYFNNYYCPNNVAICMAGDMEPARVIATLDRYFGDWQPNPALSRPEFAPLPPLTAPADTSVYGQEAEQVTLAWRFNGGASLQNDTIRIISDMLCNGKAGLMDLNLNQPLKVLGSNCYPDELADYSLLVAYASPIEGQTLEQTRDLLLGEVEKFKRGDFDDDLLVSVVNNIKRQYLQGLDNNRTRTGQMVDAFINGRDWGQEVRKLDRMSAMTKQQLVDFARRHLGDGYVCVYKRLGEDTTLKKIEKPEITPIPANRDLQSDFVRNIMAETVTPIQPQWVDFSKEMTVATTRQGLPLLYKQNTQDDLFSLTYHYEFGNTADNRYGTAFDYMDYLGTNRLSLQQFKQRMYKLACNYSFSADDNDLYITISGLGENMPQAVELVEQLITSPRVDSEAYTAMVDAVLKLRADAKSNQEACFKALVEYGLYGPRNSQTNVMSADQLRNTDPAQLVDLVKQLRGIKHTVMYYGPMAQADFDKTLSRLHKTPKHLAEPSVGNDYVQWRTPTTEILLAPYDAKNIYMVQGNNSGQRWSPDRAPIIALFNEYFGGGMNSIVFQELRETRGLAYSAAAYYRQPSRPKTNTEYAYTFIATQNDKMMDCVREFNRLIDTIPQSQGAFQLAKDALTKKLASQRTVRGSVLWAYVNTQRLGIDCELERIVYQGLPQLTMDDVVSFERQMMAHKPYRYVILGNEAELDMEALQQIAPVRRLTLEEIFGY
ncbi:MAG: insulinase family protein [Muribaculaceae bacterium]|nr:insulinase family protein [Muribaculaceae bacterium]